jgi:hypothetical protein
MMTDEIMKHGNREERKKKTKDILVVTNNANPSRVHASTRDYYLFRHPQETRRR